MKLRSLALALAVGLMFGIGPLAAQEATPSARGKAADSASASTGALLDFLRYVPNEAAYRQYVTYGDKAAWLKSWNVPDVSSIDALNQLADQPRRRWMMIMPQQTLVPSALGLQYLLTGDDMNYYGFDFFAADRYLEAGQPPDMISVIDGQFNPTIIDARLKKLGYSTSPITPEGTLYSIRGDYETDLRAEGSMPGKLGARNRIALIGARMVIARATATIQTALSAGTGATKSLADAPEYQAVVAALNDPQLADVGPLMGALLMDARQITADPASLLGMQASAEQLKQLQAALDSQPRLTPYVLSAFTTHHNAGKTYLVLALVFSANSDAETAAKNLGERIQNYTSVVRQTPFLDAIHARFERSLAVEANGLPVALVVLSADDPGPDSTAVPDWTRVVFARDLGFLYVNP